jgi:hypothetical protein
MKMKSLIQNSKNYLKNKSLMNTKLRSDKPTYTSIIKLLLIGVVIVITGCTTIMSNLKSKKTTLEHLRKNKFYRKSLKDIDIVYYIDSISSDFSGSTLYFSKYYAIESHTLYLSVWQKDVDSVYTFVKDYKTNHIYHTFSFKSESYESRYGIYYYIENWNLEKLKQISEKMKRKYVQCSVKIIARVNYNNKNVVGADFFTFVY